MAGKSLTIRFLPELEGQEERKFLAFLGEKVQQDEM